MFGTSRNMSAEQGIQLADKTINKGFIGWLTRLFMGKNFVDQANHGLAVAQKHAVDDPKRRAALMTTGIDGKAEVLNMADTGMLINYNPVVKLTLKVTPSMGAPFDITTEQQVSKIAIPRIGDVLNVKYDPTDHSNIMMM